MSEEYRTENLKREKAEEIIERKELENATAAHGAHNRDDEPMVIQSLEKQVADLQRQKSDLGARLGHANQMVKGLQTQVRKGKMLKADVLKKERIIEELEDRLSSTRAIESSSFQRELRKCKLKYEILARNEVNSKLSEINVFLETKAKEQDENEKSREEVMDKIQRDLGDRLQTSRAELSAIKGQMKETERGIQQLQSQLHKREQELILERNLRRQLEKQIDPDKLQKALINDYAKPYAYF